MLLRRVAKAGVVLIATLSISLPALACREDKTLFFSRVPRDVDAPVIAQVTVTRTAGEGDYFVGFARVEKVIKGDIEAPTVKLMSVPTSCTPGYPIGTTGIVAGTLGRASNGWIEFFPKSGRRN